MRMMLCSPARPAWMRAAPKIQVPKLQVPKLQVPKLQVRKTGGARRR